MGLSLFQIANYLLIAIFLFLFVRYLIIWYYEQKIVPPQWQYLKARKKFSKKLCQLERRYPDKVRFHAFQLQIERLRRETVPGVFVELGVYQGESAEILHEMDPEREFHLFDTFRGFDLSDLSVETGEAATYTPDHFADTTREEVISRFTDRSRIRLHPGHFPSTASDFSMPVALVNLDADLYNPTVSALKIFYPLLVSSGVIFVHDYNHKWPGIMKAVDEFVRTIPENAIFLPDKNGTAIIIRNKY